MSSKVKDGLFLGDIDAAQDAEFLQLNGIVHIINCVPRQVPNLFQQSLGLAYVPCELDEVLRRPFFDLKNRQFMAIVQLIDRALERTESVLVHSLHGMNRSPGVMIGYLMVKYCWGVDKAFEFVATKRADIKPHESYIDQLCLLEAQLQGIFGARATEQQLYEWHPALADPTTDELVLVHTYLNSTATPRPVRNPQQSAITDGQRPKTGSRRLAWIDQIAHMKKLYPSLMIKPERPPNCSYSDMTPANGWFDLIAPTSSSAAPKPIAAFVDTPPPANPRTAGVEIDEDVALISRSGRRVHSFSVPRRSSVDSVEPTKTTGDNELTIEVTPTIAASSKLQPHRIHQQQRVASSLNCTPARPLREAPTTTTSNITRTPVQSVASTVLTDTLRPVPSLPVTSTATIRPSTTKPLGSTNTKPSKPTPKPAKQASKPAVSRRASSSGVNSARGSFAGELPIAPVLSVRRTPADLADPWAANTQLTAANRPRTAPPRLRQKDSEVAVFPPQQPKGNAPIPRVNLATDYVPSGVTWAATASFSTHRLSTRTGAVPTSTRPKMARAHWK